VASFHRRLYHGLKRLPAQPFATGAGTFYDMIDRKGMIINERIDGVSRRNLDGMEKKQKMLSYFYRTLFRLMGYKRYVMFLKSLYFYCRPEMHTFLIKSKSNQL
jgi:hypothetical protein